METFQFDISIHTDNRELVHLNAFELGLGKITFLFGESGIGKSLLAKALYGLLDESELTISINNRNYKNYCQSVICKQFKKHGFFVFQEPSTHLNPTTTLKEQLNEGSLSEAGNQTEITEHLWINEGRNHFKKMSFLYPQPFRPSGGEKQRILLNMAFKKMDIYIKKRIHPDEALFVFDEPSGSLDNNHRNRFLKYLLTMHQKKPFSAIVITHDYSIISFLQENYQPYHKWIAYKELRKEKERLKLRNFTPDIYTNWLTKTKPALKFNKARQKRNEPAIFSMDPLFKIFDKMFIIKNSAGKRIDTFCIHKSEMVYLKAGSGIGKTSLAKIIMGFYRAQKVSFHISNIPLTHHSHISIWKNKIWGRKAAMVFQHADEALNLNSSVRDVFKGLPVSVPINDTFIMNQLNILFDDKIDRSFLDKTVKRLSGGQKQRLNLIRSLSLDTFFLILDEPLNGLDFFSITKALKKIEEKRRQGLALLLISHNEEIFERLIPPHNIYYLEERQ
jgi:ABC-type glutathione transport system ATPase component